MLPRFFVPSAHASGDVVALPYDEAQHLSRVLRLAVGSPIVAFDGRGKEWKASVAESGKQGVRVRIEDPRTPVSEPAVAVTLAQAVLKGEKMDDLVRDAVMIGVATIQPIVTSRSEVSLAAIVRGHRHERWGRIAVSSAKQSGRAVVPVIRPACDFESLLGSIRQRTLPAPALMLVEPSADAEASTLQDLDGQAPREVTVVIGPEGGWAPKEVAHAADTCRLVRLGARTLRADAAPLVTLAALFAVWGEF